MRISQYAYFAIFSESMTSADITGQLGIEPDGFMVRGSRTTNPPVPKRHSWEIRSEGLGLRVDEHLDQIVDRLEAHANAIGSLVQELGKEGAQSRGIGSVLKVVRHFGDDDGEEEDLSVTELPDGSMFEKLSGQHQLLGWGVSQRVINFLVATHAELDIEEYG